MLRSLAIPYGPLVSGSRRGPRIDLKTPGTPELGGRVEMATTTKKLTELMIERLKLPSGKRIEINDALAPGLVLRVNERGLRTWTVRYRLREEKAGVTKSGLPRAGAGRRTTVGAWPAMGVAAARTRAQEFAS